MEKLTEEVLARGREALVVLEVGEEVLHAGLEVVNGARRSDEAVHLHVAVQAVEEFPGTPGDVDHPLRGSNGVHIVPSEPADYESASAVCKLGI